MIVLFFSVITVFEDCVHCERIKYQQIDHVLIYFLIVINVSGARPVNFRATLCFRKSIQIKEFLKNSLIRVDINCSCFTVLILFGV